MMMAIVCAVDIVSVGKSAVFAGLADGCGHELFRVGCAMTLAGDLMRHTYSVLSTRPESEEVPMQTAALRSSFRPSDVKVTASCSLLLEIRE